METSDEWIRTSGIAERRIADDTIDTSYMAVEASKNAKMQELAEGYRSYFSSNSNTRSCFSSSCLCNSRSNRSETCSRNGFSAACAGLCTE